MRCIKVSCSCVLLQGAAVGSLGPPEAEGGSEGAAGTTDAAAGVLLKVCWKALGDSSTETCDPGTARPGVMGTA